MDCWTLLSFIILIYSADIIISQTLQGTPYPTRSIERQIKQKLTKACQGKNNTPIANWNEWAYDAQTVTLDSPYSQIPHKSSNNIVAWREYLRNVSYSFGYSEQNPEIANRPFFYENLLDHIAVNGVNRCRDSDIIITALDAKNNSYCKRHKQLDVVQIIRVTKHHRIPQLNGDYAVRATRYIPRHTVIGRFCGHEMFGFEYAQLYDQSCESDIRNHYRMSMECPRDVINHKPCPFGDQYNEIILDELDPFPANPMVILNDVRKDMTKRQLTLEDELYWNAEFHHVYVNGWPLLYVATRLPIHPGQEIATYYGPNYLL